MLIQWQEIVDRARTYADDDHNDKKGWIIPARWLSLALVEYRQLYRRWLRSGLVGPEPIDQEFTGPSVKLSGVLAVAGVIRATPSGFVGGTIDLSTLFPEISMTLTANQTTERPRLVVETGTLSYSENGSVGTLTYQPGVTNVGNLVGTLLATGTLWQPDSTEAELQALIDNLNPVTEVVDVDLPFVGGDVQVSSEWRELRKPQINGARKPFRTHQAGVEAYEWTAFGSGDDLTLRLHPADTGSYVVRYYKTVGTATSLDDYIDIPEGCDERLVLGLVRRALLKESGASGALNAQIVDADAEINFMAAAKMGGLRIKVRERLPYGFNETSPDYWYFV